MTELIFYVSVYGPEHFLNENVLFEHEPIRLLARKYCFDFSVVRTRVTNPPVVGH